MTAQPTNPWWVTGLVDGEGCFFASFRFRGGSQAFKGRGGKRYPSYEFGCRFIVLMRSDDIDVLQRLRDYFNAGYVSVRKDGRVAEYRVSKVRELEEKVIPHFEAHPLQSKKFRDFEVWREIVRLASSVKGLRGWWKEDVTKKAEVIDLCTRLREGRAFDAAVAKAAGGI